MAYADRTDSHNGQGRMPLPSKSGAEVDKFDGRSITKFLATYEDVAELYNATERSKCIAVAYWCEKDIREIVKTFESRKSHDWERLKKDMRKCFPDDGEIAPVYRKSDLMTLVNSPRAVATLADFSSHYTRYMLIAESLSKQDALTQTDVIGYFTRGLPRTLY